MAKRIDYQASPHTRTEVRHVFARPCCSVEHKLAIAAHSILEVEVGAERIDQVWNSDKPANVRAVHSALYRALWYAKDMGLITLAEAS